MRFIVWIEIFFWLMLWLMNFGKLVGVGKVCGVVIFIFEVECDVDCGGMLE